MALVAMRSKENMGGDNCKFRRRERREVREKRERERLRRKMAFATSQPNHQETQYKINIFCLIILIY